MQIARDKLISLGSSIGKLTHTGKFRLTIGALDILSQHAKYKVCVGGNCGRITLSGSAIKQQQQQQQQQQQPAAAAVAIEVLQL